MSNPGKLIVTVFLLWAFFLPISFALPTEIYQWKDKDGIVPFSDTSLPSRVETEKENFKEEYATIPKSEGSSLQARSVIAKEKRPYSNIDVIMYMTAW